MMDEKTYNKMVAANLRRLMYEKGVNGTELAKALGFTKQSVSHWMNGEHLLGCLLCLVPFQITFQFQ